MGHMEVSIRPFHRVHFRSGEAVEAQQASGEEEAAAA